MASNRPAPEGPSADEPDDRGAFLGPGEPDGNGDGPWEEWNPTEESVRSVRGKHRVAKQRAGGLTRGGTVLGVGVIAAVGASGMASAEDRPPLTISMPDVGGRADDLSDALPDAASLPGVGGLISDASDASDADATTAADAAPASGSPVAAVSGPLS
ncbi:M23 family peptidase, partial [Streptomyces kronopolitis]